MRYAYRRHPDLLKRVSDIADGSGYADMIQDMNDIAVLGQENSDRLTRINFDQTLLDSAATTAAEMGDLLARASTDRDDYSASRIIRDQAYTYLKEAMDEVRDCGQYVFWQNDIRLKGYASSYLRKKRNARKSAADTSDDNN